MVHNKKLYIELVEVSYSNVDLNAIVYQQLDNVNDCLAIVNKTLTIEGTPLEIFTELKDMQETLLEDREARLFPKEQTVKTLG